MATAVAVVAELADALGSGPSGVFTPRGGSSPLDRTVRFWMCVATPRSHAMVGWVAQLVEQWTENPCVAGSIPAPATVFKAPENAIFLAFSRAFFVSTLVALVAPLGASDCTKMLDHEPCDAIRQAIPPRNWQFDTPIGSGRPGQRGERFGYPKVLGYRVPLVADPQFADDPGVKGNPSDKSGFRPSA